MSENHHTQLPPLPVIPYAATLSLTGALSVLRDARKERILAQNETCARCETLENLSTCWQNANVVAKLGRVALRSLQQPSTGLRDFTNLLTGIDADSVDAPRIANTEAGHIDALYGRAGATSTENSTPRTQADNDLNSRDNISVDGREPTVLQSEQFVSLFKSSIRKKRHVTAHKLTYLKRPVSMYLRISHQRQYLLVMTTQPFSEAQKTFRHLINSLSLKDFLTLVCRQAYKTSCLMEHYF